MEKVMIIEVIPEKSMMIVDLPQIEQLARIEEFYVTSLSKGREWDREPLTYDDAREATKHAIVFLEKSLEKAEEFRKMMGQFYDGKDTIICRSVCYDYWCNKGGEYQITTINESFIDAEVISSMNPIYDGFNAACSKYVDLDNAPTGLKSIQSDDPNILGKRFPKA